MKKLYLNWNDSYTLRQFVDQMTKCEINGEKQIKIVAPVRMKTYPDICVPLTVLIDGYRDKGFEFEFVFPGDNNYVKHTSISNPLQVEEMFDSPELKFPLDKV